MKILTNETFKEAIETNSYSVVDFYADWCGPCRMMSPIVEELAKEYDGKALICKVDLDASKDIAIEYSVRSIPTFLFIKNGQVIDRHIGGTSKKTIEEKIKKLMAEDTAE